MLVVGRRVFPWLLWQVARTGSRELFTLCVVAAAVSIAFGSAELFGVSFALGAFFAGMVMRESEFSHRAAEESLPLRDAFAVLFFVSVGMLFDPSVLIERRCACWPWSPSSWSASRSRPARWCSPFRYPLNTALTVAASLAQIGEFSFILAGLGAGLGLLPPEGQSLILAGALISITLNSAGVQRDRAARSAGSSAVRRSRAARRARDDPLAELPMATEDRYLAGQVVLVGYGRVGRRIAAALDRGDTSLSSSPSRTANSSRSCANDGIPAVCGDAADLARADPGACRARPSLLVIATPDTLDVPPDDRDRTAAQSRDRDRRAHPQRGGGRAAARRRRPATVFLGEQELAQQHDASCAGALRARKEQASGTEPAHRSGRWRR